MRTLPSSRYRRPALFWGGLVLVLVILSLFFKIVRGVQSSAVFRLSRVNILAKDGDEETVISLEGKSAVYYKVPAGLKPLLLPVSGRIIGSSTDYSRLFWQAFRGKLKTDLSKYDLLLLSVESLRLNNDKVQKIEGKPELAKFFKDSRLRNESLPVAVVNSTNHPGLAQLASQMIENCGGRVIKVEDSEEGRPNCQVVTGVDRRSYTRTWLVLTFGCEEKYSPVDNRADLTLVLGEANWKTMPQ